MPAELSAEKAFETWWLEQTRKGDPARRPNLVRDAFMAAFDLGRNEMTSAAALMADLAAELDETDDGEAACIRMGAALRELL